MSAMAISNNDVVFLAWSLDQAIPNCLGFAIYRKDEAGNETPLPAWVGFAGGSNPDWKARTTAEWPIQKFTWKDLTAERGKSYSYRIVPMVGAPGNLKEAAGKSQTTSAVKVTEERGSFNAYFNRGILSTQSLAHQVAPGPNGAPNYMQLKGRIDQPNDPLRNELSGQLREAMLELFPRARAAHGQLYLALYELTDPELESALLAGKGYVHLILSNTGVDDGENAPARQALHHAGVDITDRMVGSGHIGHNKFAVIVDGQNKPIEVWTGSTNWTDTGLCAQSNNGLLIKSPDVAKLYMDYWNRLKADGGAQAAPFRKQNDVEHDVAKVGAGTDVTIWFSPNTTVKRKPSQNPPTPDDMTTVFAEMAKAREAILFLVFQPGSPSVIEKAAELQNANPGLFIHGAATDPGAVNAYETLLFHRTGQATDADVVAASAVNDQFSYWEKELLKSGPSAHAIIHDKIVVIDPFSPNCVVITGSHNLGYTASYANDENLVIVRGNQALAQAYAVHVMDIYDHYRWRFMLQQNGPSAWTGLATTADWQTKYFEAGSDRARELAFWLQQGQPAGAVR